MTKRPNILFIMADQLSARFLPVYGNTIVKAPNLEALAERSAVFEASYCPSPLCSPSRYAMLSGQLPSKLGAYDNANEVASDVPMMPHYLRDLGYRTALSGKMHFVGPDQLHGFEERLTTDIYPADYGWTADWNVKDDRPAWYYDMPAFMQAGVCQRSNQIDYDEEAVFAGRKFIYDAARSEEQKPFFLVVSMSHPHDPYFIQRKYWELYREEEIDLPDLSTSPDADDPHWLRIRRQVLGIDDRCDVTESHIRRARRAYYGAISFVDEQVGILLATLKDAGLEDDTIVVFTADHGDMLGERGLWDKMVMFENAVRVPLMISHPAGFPARRIPEPVSTLDLLPTLLELVGDENPEYAEEIDGRSLLSHLRGIGGHDDVACEYLGEGALSPILMLRRANMKYVRAITDPEQLYDLDVDPMETTNLAASPEHATVLAEFRRAAEERWDERTIHREILTSQKKRLFVDRALKRGRFTSWDFQPYTDASKAYMRNHLGYVCLDDLEVRARLQVGTKHL